MPLWYSGYQNARETCLCQPTHQARFVQRVDNALKIHPVDNAIIFTNSYLPDSDLSGSLHNRRNIYFLRFSGERGQE